MRLGIEIGGTKLQLGLGPGDGTLVGLWRGTVDVAAGGEGIRRQIQQAVPELLANAGLTRGRIEGVGIGFGGPVDDATRTVIKSHQIPGWDSFPLARWIEDLLGWPAALGNDSDVAGLAEALFGAGKGLSPLFYFNVGSGIGGALIIDGEVYRGCGRGAAEFGHLMHGECDLGAAESHLLTVEDVASGWGIAERSRELAREGPLRDRLGDGDVLTARDVADAARAGDEIARYVLDTVVSVLADALCQVIVLLCPRRIVVGGGVPLMGDDLFLTPLRRRVARRVFPPFADCFDIVPAALGEEVVLHGALALARRSLKPASYDSL